MSEALVPALLAVQGVLGGIDTLLNHEWLARLPKRPEARGEIGLHSIREATYATLFAGFAWFDMQGSVCALVAALLVLEVIITSCDEFVENRIRLLPQNERVLHIF